LSNPLLYKALRVSLPFSFHRTTEEINLLFSLSMRLFPKGFRYVSVTRTEECPIASLMIPTGVISFGLKGGRELSIKFMDSLKLAAIVTHVADARTCVLHPASHTHRQLTDEQLIEAGVRPDLIRLSVGIENADDIIADIEQALNA